jgi:translation initiation factor 2-alpha kinase 3
VSFPTDEYKKERVLNEVKFLAKMDHKNIIRYYNAWTETPPEGILF